MECSRSASEAPEGLAEAMSPDETKSTSIGLRNVDGRLRALYGEEHGLHIVSEGSGTLAEIRIPAQE